MRLAEFIEILKAYLAITLAFGILLWRGYSINLSSGLLISALTVGTGFVLHELAHKFVAQRYGAKAEFRAFTPFLVLAVAMSFFGFVFAAPGAVFIRGFVTKEKNGWISASGIIANIVAAALFFALFVASPTPFLKAVGSYGAMINSWLAVFNLIPFGNFDGVKVLQWNKLAFILLVTLGFGLMLLLIMAKIM
jgi:Zn-dependent protease